jgi:hypothetical protein
MRTHLGIIIAFLGEFEVRVRQCLGGLDEDTVVGCFPLRGLFDGFSPAFHLFLLLLKLWLEIIAFLGEFKIRVR